MNNQNGNSSRICDNEVLILGGGIAGVYLAWLLSKTHSSPGSIRVIESGRLGGRVHSVSGSYRGKGYGYEAGAARFFTSHKLLNSLIKEFGFDRKSLLEISGDAQYHFPENSEINGKWIVKHIRQAVKILKNTPDVGKFSTLEALVNGDGEKMDHDLVKTLFKATGYPHILDGNAEAAISICRQDYLANHKYYLFLPGLETLVKKMVEDSKSRGVIFTPGSVTRWNTSSGRVELSNGHHYRGRRVVCAIPPSGIRGITITGSERQLVGKVCGYLKPVPLLRQFSMYPKLSEQIPGKLVTSNPIQRQYLGGGGLVQTSYTSGTKAKWWLLMDPDSKRETLEKYQLDAYGVSLPKPVWNREYYWEGGVHMWKPGKAIQEMYQEINDCGDSRWWFCGEAYQLEKRWIESALQSALRVSKEIEKNRSLSSKSKEWKPEQIGGLWFLDNNTQRNRKTMKIDRSKQWTPSMIRSANRSSDRHLIVISNSVYDVRQWLSTHPGGMRVLNKWKGQDATSAFNGKNGTGVKHHHSPFARKILDKYKVGIVKKNNSKRKLRK